MHDGSIKICHFGLVLDAHLLFENLFSMLSRNEDTIKTLHSMQKLNLTNMSEGICIQSFETRIPKLLSKNNTQGIALAAKVKGSGTSHFEGVASYARWDEQITGTRDVIAETLRQFEITHQEQIETGTFPDTKARTIATQSLLLASGWITKFLGYIDDTYKNLMKQHTFTAAQSWLTTLLGRRVLIEVSVPRNGIITAVQIGVDSQDQISKLVLWPIVRSHDIMKKYKDANFADHPSIAAEYVKFLTAHSGYEVISQLSGQVVSLQEELVVAVKTAESAKKQASNAMNLVDELNKTFQALEKKFASPGNKGK